MIKIRTRKRNEITTDKPKIIPKILILKVAEHPNN